MRLYDLHEKFHSKFCYPVMDYGQKVLHIQNPHVLSQIVGFAKFLANGHNNMVLMRGQGSLHNCRLLPSLYRTLSSDKKINVRNVTIEKYCSKVHKCFTQNSTLKLAKCHIEPILQHYGINTRWIDLVDNIWIALWFATHTLYKMDRIHEGHPIYAKWKPVDDDNCYRNLKFEDRKAKHKYIRLFDKICCRHHHTSNQNNQSSDIIESTNKYAYILLLETGMRPTSIPGLFIDEELQSHVVDLRYVCPSVFLRPHNQHGLLLRKIGKTNDSLENYNFFEQFVVGILRVEIKDALKWLGDGFLLSSEFLFPSPFSDFMYRYLIEMAPPDSLELGSIIRYWQ